MRSFLEWLLDLEAIRLGPGADVTVQWESVWPRWVVVAAVLLVIGYVAAMYRREGGTPRARLALGAIRAVLLVGVLALLCQPVLVLKRNRTERSTVALLVDTSASMNHKDRYDDKHRAALAALVVQHASAPAGQSPTPTSAPAHISDRTRAAWVRQTLAKDAGAVLRELVGKNRVEVYRFAGTASLVATLSGPEDVSGARETLGELQADGESTDIGRSIRQVFGETRGRRVAAVILATDGRNSRPVDLNPIIETARRREVPIHTIRIGSPVPPRDIIVGSLQAEQRVFVKDLLAVKAKVSATGYDEATSVTVQLREDGLDTVLAEQAVSLRPGAAAARVELCTKAADAGRRRYRVSVRPLPDEAETANNADVIEVDVVDTKVRLLYVEAYPRYEYRYLKNTLLREETITSSCLLLSADEEFAQEGDEPIRRFPETPEELNRYDVVLFGDVDPRGDWITEPQLTMLLDFVGNRGGGFGVIAGQRNAPHRFRGTALEKLLPVAIDLNFSGRYEETLTDGFTMKLTVEGEHSAIFRFEQDPQENLKTLAALPELYWLCRTGGVKPGAEALAQHPTIQTVQGPMPVVVVGRYGAGKLFFQATDDTWRWRRYGGEAFFDAYWLQVARYLTVGKLVGRDRTFRLDSDRREYRFGQPVLIRLTVFDAVVRRALPAVLEGKVLGADGGIVRTVSLRRLSEDSKWYEGSFVPSREGNFSVEVDVPSAGLGGPRPTTGFRVSRADLEARIVHADHQFLEQLSAATGGESVFLPDLPKLAERIPDRSIRIPDDLAEPLWDTKLILALLALIITVEWVARKACGMI